MKSRNNKISFITLCLFCLSITACQSQDSADQSSGSEEKAKSSGQVEKNAAHSTDGTASDGDHETADEVVLGPDSVKQFEGEGDMRFLDQTPWYEINKKNRDIKAKGESYSTEDYLSLALSYLMLGHFDTAIELLEECKEKAPPRQTLLVGYNGTLEAAKDVKRALTAARNQLQKGDKSITYPDERIFIHALKSASRDDHRLILNLSDAWATAFPESRVALQNDAEQNLGFFEEWPGETNVLAWRTIKSLHRGEGALRRLYKLDRSDSYPIIRLMQNTLATILPKEGHPRSRRQEFYPEMEEFLSKMNSNENLSNAQKAFLKYGQAMFFLFNDEGWQKPRVYIGVDYLNEAIKLDPGQKLYKDALVSVQANTREIERVKLERGKIQRAQSMAAAREMFSPKSTQSRQRVDIINLMMQAMFKVIHESVKKEHGEKGEKIVGLIESVGCPGCWGSGKDLGGGVCPMCQGTANWYDFNK